MQDQAIAAISRDWAFQEGHLGFVPEHVFPMAIHEPDNANTDSLQQLILPGTYPSIQVVFCSKAKH